MAQASLSDEACQQAADAFARFGSQRAAADSLGISRSTFQHRINEAERRGFMGDGPRMVMKGQSVLYDAQGNERGRWDKTRLAGRPEADTVQLPDPKRITKTSRLFDQTGAVIQQWVTEKPQDAEREALWRAFAEALSEDIARAKPIPVPAFVTDDFLTIYAVGDHHMGMMAWGAETGGGNYDLNISSNLLAGAMTYLAASVPASKHALIMFLGDFTHTDGYAAMTPASGHLLDADGRFPKIAAAAARAMRHAIDTALNKHEVVHVIVSAGNHDPVSTIWLRIALSAAYENEPRVTIDETPGKFHYFEWGKNLIGATHADRLKLESLPAIMATDQPEAWGRTLYRLWLTGHVHHDRVKDLTGAKVESVRVLAPLDAYAAKAGYRTPRDMKAIIFHREYGEAGRFIAPAAMFQEVA